MSDSEAQGSLESIAIIGMSGHFPAAGDLDMFWRNLRDGVESISFFSEQELLAAGVDPLLLRSPKYVRANAVLEGFDRMDAAFFGFSPREAEIMDPQLRLFLECAWVALEDAGYDSETYTGAIGVYGGMSMSKYLFNNLASNRALMESEGPLQIRILNDKDFLASLVAYKLNLRGPSVTVQTACSTSLVAVCMACQSLLSYQSDLALAGGVSINIPHQAGYFALDGLFSPDGHCRAFDAQAQGTVGGNGVGMVVLKRLEDALADGDHIHAIIKGSAINNDGAMKVSYTAPGVDGQFEVVAMAQAVAGITADTISYVETHGTGTPLGDQIEIDALTRAFRASTQQTGFCAIGSVKPNIGHLDAAAGIASLIKTILALKHKQIPPSLHVTVPNPQIDFANSPFYVNTRLSEWTSATPRRAGVSSFAIGGINAHVVLEEAPERAASEPSRPWLLLLLSARTSSALEAMTSRLADFLKQHPQHNLADVAYTLQVGRRAFEHRRMLVCADHADALAVLEGRDPRRVLTSANITRERPVAFMFPGLGDHYADMTRELYQHESVFREHVDLCCELLDPHLSLDLRDVLYPGLAQHDASALAASAALPQPGIDLRRMLRPDRPADMTSALQQTFLTQPILFVIEYALAQLWRSWGVHPQAMIGYSIGEYVAACLAGVMSLADALLIVARRAQMIESLPRGAMLAVALSEADVRPFLSATLSLAAINGPSVCVLAGPVEVITVLERQLSERGVVCRWLQTAHAFHSWMMEPIASAFAEVLERVELHSPSIPYISNVTGTWITAAQATDPAYWARHLCQTVRFADGVRELWQARDRVLLEVGPGQTLSSWALQHPASADAIAPIALASLRHAYDAQSDLAFLRTTLGKLWLAGLPVDWSAYYGAERRQRVPLPTYPFERERYWIEPYRPTAGDAAQVAALAPRPDIADWFSVPVWKHATPLAPIDDAALATRRSWLVFLDQCGVGARLVERLGGAGQDVVSVRVGAQFERLGERAYAISPRTGADYAALFADLRAHGALPELIVHLWGVTATTEALPTLTFAETCQDLGFYSLLLLAQALGDQGSTAGLHIAVISSDVQDVIGDERLHPAKATMLGPCMVIPQEYPHITCRSVDIVVPESGSAQADNLTDLLLAEVLAPASDSVIAYRGNRRWVQVFESIRRAGMAGSQTRLREEGVYLITGGLGGIGLVLADYLARTVRARLVLVGRSAFPAREEWQHWLATHDDQDDVSRKIRALQAIEQRAAVLIASADVADHDGMREVLDRTYEHFGALHGVIHAAGVMPGGMMQLKTIEQAACVLAPKVRGTLVLADLLSDVQLDFLMLCSSLNALIGGFGLVDHCAANAFLDAFAHAAAAQGATFTLSINWDAWLEVGQAARAAAASLSGKASRPLHNYDPIDHPLLDVRSDDGADQTIYLTTLSTARHWMLDEHRIAGMGILPGTAYLEMAWAAVERHVGDGPISMQKVHFSAPLLVRDGEDREVRTVIKKDSAGFSFIITSAPTDQGEPRWAEHASGKIRSAVAGGQRKHAITAIIARCTLDEQVLNTPRSAEDHMRFGPRWRGLTKRVWIGEQESLVLIELPEEFAADLELFKLHPALMDAATGFVQGVGEGRYLPLAYEKLTINAALPRKIYSYVQRKAGDRFEQAMIACDIAIMDEDGVELVAIQDYTLRRLPDSFAFDTPASEPAGSARHPRMMDDAGRDHEAAGAELELAYQLTNGIAPAVGAELFGEILAGAIRLPQIAVSTRDLQRRIAQARALTGARVLEAIKQARPARIRHARTNITTAYAAPRSELERKLAGIWEALLGIEQVGIHDNFFDSGGDSLLATRLIAQVEEIFGVDLPLRALFEAPTVAELAVVIVHRQAGQVEDEALAQVLTEIGNLSPAEVQALLVAETVLNSEEGVRE